MLFRRFTMIWKSLTGCDSKKGFALLDFSFQNRKVSQVVTYSMSSPGRVSFKNLPARKREYVAVYVRCRLTRQSNLRDGIVPTPRARLRPPTRSGATLMP